ncbi:MAG TPA: methyltransferase [Geobacteraceae bacterium]|nr:methyltransferase [Geobacteraceae bacterium]
MEKSEWTIPDLLQLSGSYWGVCSLHAGVRLDVFTALNGAARSAEEVAASCVCDARAMEMLLNALTAQGLLEKGSSGYANTPFSSQNLVRGEPGYLGHIILHHHHLMQGWAHLHKAVINGSPAGRDFPPEDEAAERESFLMGMFNLASQLAPRIAAAVDLTGFHRLLDFGGGPGTYAVHFCRQNPGLAAVVYDLPSSRSFAEGIISRYGLGDRISFTSGNYHLDQGPAGFDVAWLSHILHAEGPEGCRTILRKAVEALQPGGKLLVQEFILNDAKDGPSFPALFSLNMLLVTTSGRSYSESELRVMMEEAGLSGIKRLAIDLPNGAGIMAGTVG